MKTILSYTKASRWQFALKVAGVHFLLSLFIAGLVAWLVFGIWYPSPLDQLTRGRSLFLILVFVDLVCGPLITLIIANPRKSRKELFLDFSLIALVQLGALFYGLHVTKMARPVLFSFEKDRIAIVTESEVDKETLSDAPESLRRLPLFGINKIGIRSARNEKEFFESIHLAFEGMEPSVRPGWWREFPEVLQDLRKAMKPLAEVQPLREAEQKILDQAVERSKKIREELYYLPLVSKYTQDWLVLMNSKGEFLSYAKINGFDLSEGGLDNK